MSTSKYLCKRDGEGYHFCRTIGSYPREGKGEATQAPQQLSQNKSMKETGANKGEGRPPSTEVVGQAAFQQEIGPPVRRAKGSELACV